MPSLEEKRLQLKRKRLEQARQERASQDGIDSYLESGGADVSGAQHRAWGEDLSREGGRLNPIQENPYISATDRFAVKNLGNASSIQYLQEKYPDLEFAQSPSGDPIYTKRGANEPWYAMDPGPSQTFKIPRSLSDAGAWGKEFAADLGDIAVDVPIGIAEGAAALGGGTLGAVSGTILGGVPGGIAGGLSGATAGGGLAGRLLEDARQRAGQFTGVAPEKDQGMIEQAGLLGAGASLLGPMVSSSGRGALRTLGKNPEVIARPFNKAREAAVDAMQHGLAGTKAADKQRGRQFLDRIISLERKYDEPMITEPRKLSEEIAKTLESMENQIWDDISEKMALAGKSVDTSNALKNLESRMDAIKKRRADRGGRLAGDEEELTALQNLRDRYFTKKVDLTREEKELLKSLGVKAPPKRVPMASEVDIHDAVRIKQDLQDLGSYDTSKMSMTPTQKREVSIARDLAGDVRQAIDTATQSVDSAGVGVHGLNKAYKDTLARRAALEKAGVVKKGAGGKEEYPMPAYMDDIDTPLLPHEVRARDRFLNYGKHTELQKALESLDQYNANIGNASNFDERARVLEASSKWMLPDKVGIPGKGASSDTGLMRRFLATSAGGGLGILAGGAGLSPWTVGLAAAGAAASKLSTPRAARAFMRGGRVAPQAYEAGRFSPMGVPVNTADTALRTTAGNYFNPWGQLELDERRQLP